MSSSVVQYHAKDWARIEKLGLHPSVVAPDGYAARILVGMKLAHSTLAETKETVPTIATIKGLHYLAFESVHPWAGEFRQEGHEVRAGRLVCSLAKDVVGDLMRLRKEMVDNPLTGSKQYKAEVLAFYHASFLAIHPFADGNGRVSRIILDVQTKRLLGHPLSTRIGRDEYIGALSVAQGEGNLGDLAKLISRNDLKISRGIKTTSVERGIMGDLSDGLLVSKPKILGQEGESLRVKRL
jgi:fido (protein-threonine AMPylation protein)